MNLATGLVGGGNGVLVAIFIYVLAQFAIGVWVSRRISSEADYILAGRTLGPLLVTFSVFATFFGSEAITASTAAVYEKGLSGALIDPIGYAVAIMIVGLFFAARLRARDITTFADLFRNRFSPGVERLVVAIMLPGSLFWAAAQIRVFAIVLSSNGGMAIASALAIAALIVAIYSIVGGLMADAVTDTLQGIVVIAGLALLTALVLQDPRASLSLVAPARMAAIEAGTGWLALAEKIAVPVCGTIVAVELVSRFLGARTPAVAARGTLGGGILYFIVGLSPIFLGLVGPQLIPQISNPEEIVSKLAEQHMPPVLHIVFVGAIVSAVLSTVHSTLHAPAAQISHNVISRIWPDLSRRRRLWAVRATVGVLSLVAYAMAATSETIKDLVELASAFGAAGVFVVMMFAMFSRYGGAASAVAAIFAGEITWAWTKYVWLVSAPFLAGLCGALAAYVIVAELERRSTRERVSA